MSLPIFTLLLFAVCLNVAAQLVLKMAMQQIGHFDFTLNNITPIATQVFVSPWIWLGLTIYVFSLVTWLLVLSRTNVSTAYPLISLGYVINAIAAHYMFGEILGPMRIAGIAVILLGVYLIAR